MKTAFRHIAILVLILLTSCATPVTQQEVIATDAPTASSSAVAAASILSLDSSSGQIQQAMLYSTSYWKSIWVDGTVTWYDTTGSNQPPTVYHEQVWIEPSVPRFRTLLGNGNEPANKFTASDGSSIIDIDLKSGQSQVRSLPTFAKDPTTITQTLWGQIGTPMSEILLSMSNAISDGTFKTISMDEVAGRQTLVVEWTRDGISLPQWRMWLDTQTAVILKLQEFGKGGGADLQSERVVNKVSFDDIFPDTMFNGQGASLPQFSDKFGVPLVLTQTVPPAEFGSDPLGEVYFTLFDPNYRNETSKLMRISGSCAAGISPCPEAQDVKLTGATFNFANVVFTWTRDGSAAAYVYPVSEDGNRNGLFVFNPADQSSQNVAEFNFIDPPLWSSDGIWLAFRVQDGNGSDEIYAVKRDGSQLTDLSMNKTLPTNGQPYVMNGWLDHGVILSGKDNMVYLVNADDGSSKPLFDKPWVKSLLFPSPDGSALAYTDSTEYKTVLKLISPQSNKLIDLATFQSNSSIYPILWSSDGMQIAFGKETSDLNIGQDIYIIGRDGRNFQQVYHSSFATITDFSFSPDGKYMLLSDHDATGQHLFMIDLATLGTHILQIPGLSLDWWWMYPSWKP